MKIDQEDQKKRERCKSSRKGPMTNASRLGLLGLHMYDYVLTAFLGGQVLLSSPSYRQKTQAQRLNSLHNITQQIGNIPKIWG